MKLNIGGDDAEKDKSAAAHKLGPFGQRKNDSGSSSCHRCQMYGPSMQTGQNQCTRCLLCETCCNNDKDCAGSAEVAKSLNGSRGGGPRFGMQQPAKAHGVRSTPVRLRFVVLRACARAVRASMSARLKRWQPRRQCQ